MKDGYWPLVSFPPERKTESKWLKLFQKSSFIFEENIIDAGIGPQEQEGGLWDQPGWEGGRKTKSARRLCAHTTPSRASRCLSSMGPVRLPVTTTSPALLLPIKKGTVSCVDSSSICFSRTLQVNESIREKQNRALVIWKCRNQWMLSYGRWTGCSEFVLFLLIQSLHPNYPLHCSSGPAGWCQFTAVFVPPLVWWIYVYRYVSCFPHHTCKKSQRQVALHSVQMETGNLSDSPHVSSWRRRKHPGFWLKGRWWPGLPRGKTIRSSWVCAWLSISGCLVVWGFL